MKKIITCTLVAAVASLSLPVLASATFDTSGEGNTGGHTTSTSFVYDSTTPTTSPVFTTNLVAGQEEDHHGVLADTTFLVPAGVASAKLGSDFVGVNSASNLEATFAADTNAVASVKTVAKTLTSGEKLHILLQNSGGGALNSGATTVTYNVTTYTN
ncbi:hypothetical protein AU892_27330 [Salmonella enterica subsp. diarizonae]|nr:hypothetical protein [Salmonella enterica subsp. diarizonae]